MSRSLECIDLASSHHCRRNERANVDLDALEREFNEGKQRESRLNGQVEEAEGDAKARMEELTQAIRNCENLQYVPSLHIMDNASCRSDLLHARNHLSRLEQKARDHEAQRSDAMARFGGGDVRRVIDVIEQNARRFKKRPFGPLGTRWSQIEHSYS